MMPKRAGIGVFIINTQVHPPQHIYIKAVMAASYSVLMAEAAALALAADISKRLNLQHMNFLSDNQELVHFLNSTDHSNPPDWRIKHLTQHFFNCSQQRSTKIFKIRRSLNQTADILARQALQDFQSSNLSSCVCSNTSHVHQCPLLVALQSMRINSVSLLTARCC